MALSRVRLFLPALAVAAGLALAGRFVGEGIASRDQGGRSVSVKGLAEREVPASVAIWNIAFSASGNDLAEINRKLGESTAQVTAFLKESGFAETEMAIQPPALVDTTMAEREKDVPLPLERFRASQSVLLRTANVDAVKPALAATSSLIMRGVLLSGGGRPNYIFNQLNEVKPGMIQEATRNARIAAEQFSRDSETPLGKLRSASQGWFQVEDRDAATPERKTVRVVVDVVYAVE